MLSQWKSLYGLYIRPYLTLTVLGVVFWAILALKLLSVAFMLLVQLLHHQPVSDQTALDLGQRAIVHLATEETEGNIRTIQKQSTISSETIPASGGKDKLTPAPLFSLVEQSSKGPLPVIGHDGTIPWHYYARPFTPHDKHPMVAIVLTNVGLSAPLTKEVMKLPHTITLSISPFAGDARNWAKLLRAEGFESLVDLPMESDDDVLEADSSTTILRLNVNANENSTRLHWTLSRFPGFVGALAPIHEHMTANSVAVRPVLDELNTRGLLFLYVKNINNTAVADITRSQGLKTLPIDVVLDEDASPIAIRSQLKALADIAQKQGYAIGVAHSYPTTLDALNEWAELFAAQNIDLAPVSAIAHKVYP